MQYALTETQVQCHQHSFAFPVLSDARDKRMQLHFQVAPTQTKNHLVFCFRIPVGK
jgi:hypothetical protein